MSLHILHQAGLRACSIEKCGLDLTSRHGLDPTSRPGINSTLDRVPPSMIILGQTHSLGM